jgi:signal transduction histidine kinase
MLQSLQGVMLMISAAAVHLKEGDESYKLLQRALILAKETIDEGRNRTSSDSSVHHIRGRGMADKLRRLGQRMERRYGASFEMFERVDLPPNTLDAGLYAIVREALHHAYRHSGASSVSCTIDAMGEDILIAIRDNGQGFILGNASDTQRGYPALQRVSERAALLGMEVSMKGELGGGTSVTVRVPTSGSAELTSSSQSPE